MQSISLCSLDPPTWLHCECRCVVSETRLSSSPASASRCITSSLLLADEIIIGPVSFPLCELLSQIPVSPLSLNIILEQLQRRGVLSKHRKTNQQSSSSSSPGKAPRPSRWHLGGLRGGGGRVKSRRAQLLRGVMSDDRKTPVLKNLTAHIMY